MRQLMKRSANKAAWRKGRQLGCRAGLAHGLRGEEGSSLVEMGLATVILMMLVLGVIQFSLLFFAYNEVSDAARMATRWAAVRGANSCANTNNGLAGCGASAADITTYVQGLGYPGLVASQINVSPCWLQQITTPTSTVPISSWPACGGSNSPGNEVQVKVSYAYPVIVPYWRAASITVSSTAAMVVAQ